MTTRPLLVLTLLAVAACTPKRIVLPSGDGQPFPEFQAAYQEASVECSSVKTLAVAIGLSGRVGTTKLRGRVDAGFSAPASVRLEGVAPFGKPVFVLVATGDDATLVLPRDERVLTGAPPAAIVEALAGVPLGASELRGLIAGCGLSAGEPTDGRRYEHEWAAVTSGATTTYLRQAQGRWRIAAATRGPMTIDYADIGSGGAATVHIQMTPGPGTAPANLTLRISQLEINTPLAPAVFAYDVPRYWAPLTLEELRRAGPLGEGASVR